MMLRPSAPIAKPKASASVSSVGSVSRNGARNAAKTLAPTQTCLGRVLKRASSWAYDV